MIAYKGVVCYVRVKEGTVKPGTKIKTNGILIKYMKLQKLEYLYQHILAVPELKAGDVGYFTASIKNVRDARVGDTVTEAERPAGEALRRI